jgi:F-type H+-transporting ATPase subunit gamma
MANLKDLKNRIKSVKSTQKITKAMKMVAASKLRRARSKAEEAEPYASEMKNIVEKLVASLGNEPISIPLLSVKSTPKTHLIVVVASDRGLCGAFNSSIFKMVKKKIFDIESHGIHAKLLCVGKKGYELLKPLYKNKIIDTIEGISKKKQLNYSDAEFISKKLLSLFANNEFDVCSIVYNKFKSAISQIPTFEQLIPVDRASEDNTATQDEIFEYEPDSEQILSDLLPKNLSVQIFQSLLESSASEQGARMTAMDNASRSAGVMIKDLTLIYNRTRQAAITKELIEIISGAEAV